MSKEFEQLDNAQLLPKLKEWLESSPLYTEHRYTGGSLIKLPDEIELFCGQCERKTTWRNVANRTQTPNDKLQLQQRSYRCANCKEQQVHFLYSWYEEPKRADGIPVVVFRKYGQWPAIEERVTKELQEALNGTDDLKFYKTALRLRNFGYGVGAMLYMRRVIENHMSDMIQILQEEAKKSGQAGTLPEQQIPARFADKVDYADKLFPADLKPKNLPNPVKPLYLLASDAIHNLSETEAVTLFDQCRKVFEYVFSGLRPALKDRREFLDSLRAITELSASKSA